MEQLTKTVFCANEQTETPHVLSMSLSGEVQTTCGVCGRVLKFPAGIDSEGFDALLAAHKESNQGQVTQEAINKTLLELADKPEAKP